MATDGKEDWKARLEDNLLWALAFFKYYERKYGKKEKKTND